MKTLVNFLLSLSMNGILMAAAVAIRGRGLSLRSLETQSRRRSRGKTILKTGDGLVDEVVDRIDDVVDQ